MRHRLLLAALLTCVPGMAPLQLGAQAALPEPPSMRFAWVKEGPPAACGVQCREWISATGPITADTARDFQLFTEARDVRGATLVLDSGGGSVLASLELGRKVRSLAMKTTVGRTVAGPDDQPSYAKLSPRGECASMCVFVLLGGVHRTVPAEARILVHQIWPGSKRYDASAETYTAEEMVRIQRDVGRIAKYTIEMGGDIELFELAMRIPPWERLRSLSQTELRRLRLQSIEVASEVPTSGAVTVERKPRAMREHLPERGWTLIEGGANPALSRRHTITIEGEEIGQFELSLACGAAADNFKVAYADARALGGEPVPARLDDVTLWSGGARVALTVDTSAPQTATAELQSTASGVVPVAFVDRLRKDPSGTVVVGTRTSDNVRTSIRVGSAGFSKAFSQLEAECAK